MVDELSGRAVETRSIEAFLDRAAEGAAVLVLSGEPGIGKTALWEAGLESARARRARVLAYRAVEAEAVLSFAGISGLLEGLVDELLPSLGALRRRALEAALLLDGSGDVAGIEPRAIGLAVLDSLTALSATRPVIVAIDDFRWLDTPSARTLLFVLRRLGEQRVGALLTVRGGARELDRGLPSGAAEQLRVGPLDLGALFAILRRRLGVELSRPQLRHLLEVTGGNPFFALEIGRQFASAPPGPGRPLRVPGTLRDVLGERLGRLRGGDGDVLLLVAACGRPTVELLAAAHGERSHVLAGLEQAVEAGVVDLDQELVRFTHPLLASVCYDEASPWKRREAHARLAAVVDGEERAQHLALATEGSDAAVAAALDEAAPHALDRGAPAAAAEVCEIAAQLTPPGDPAARRRRRLAAAEAHRIAGDRDRAAAILDELLAEAPPGPQRADVLFALAQTRRADLPAIARWCESALAEAGDDHRRAAELLTFLSWTRLLEGRVRDALEHARAAFGHAELAGDGALLARAIARLAMAETWTLEITPGVLERGVAIEQCLARPLEFHESPRITLARRLMCLSDFDGARPLLAAAEERAKASGDEGTRAHVLFHGFQVEWFTGRWEEADRLAAEGLQLADQLRDEQYRGLALYARALLDAHLGDLDAARDGAAAALAPDDAQSDALFGLQSRTVLGFLELSLGHAAAADRHLRPLPAWLHVHGWNEPTDFAWCNAIEAMIAVGELGELGELGEAGVWLARYEALAERSGSPLGARDSQPWTRAAVGGRGRSRRRAGCARERPRRARPHRLPLRARTHARRAGRDSSTRPPEALCARRARRGLQHLRRARCAPLDPSGTRRAPARERSPPGHG